MKRVIMKLLTSIVLFSSELSVILADCVDIYGKSITPNAHFIPGPDICQLCVCDNTIPKWCKRVLCSPPQNCKSFVMGSSCCDYSCLDNTLPNVELRDEIDRRFLITLATGFVILTILLFVIHKIRHRTIQVTERLQTRPLNEDRRSIGSIGFITGSIGYLNLPNAHNFDDHPIVHFPIYKPNGYYSRGEAPPPYDEAMADARLASYAEIEMLSNERCLQDPNYQRRRNQALNHPIVIDSAGNCMSEPRPGENGVFVEDSTISDNTGGLLQHRTIPLPLCVNSERTGFAADSALLNVGPITRSRSLHEKNNDFNHARVCSNFIRRPCTSGSRPNTCPPQLHLEVTSLDEASLPASLNRSLPLSASLSSPLPSTSDADHRDQFAGIISGPTFSSATNICPSSNNDQNATKAEAAAAAAAPQSSRKHHHHHHHHKTCRKALQTASADADDTSVATVKCANERVNKSSYSRESTTPGSNNREAKEAGGSEMLQVAEDYHAECENCNLNVGANSCDTSDEYFSKQETMTLQRNFHDVTIAQAMGKVSLTLPTNSRTRHRCSSKNRKCGMWNAKESSYKATLELVSSEDEYEEEAAAAAAASSSSANATMQIKSPELSVDDAQKNADENAK